MIFFLSGKTSCNENHPIFNKNENIKFRREHSLEQIFNEFINQRYDPTKPRKQMITHEAQFRKIVQNLQLHLGSKTIETNIFKGIESVMQRDYKKELKSEKIQSCIQREENFHWLTISQSECR